MTDQKLIQAVAGAIEATRAKMDAERDKIPRHQREPYFDKLGRKGPNTGQHIVGYRSKLLEAQARAAITVVNDWLVARQMGAGA